MCECNYKYITRVYILKNISVNLTSRDVFIIAIVNIVIIVNKIGVI